MPNRMIVAIGASSVCSLFPNRRHKRVKAVALLVALASAACAVAQTVSTPGLSVETVIDADLTQPIAIAFIGANDFLVCEKASGQVKRVTNGVVVSTVLDLPVVGGGERGLLGIALHPNFAANQFVYLYYSRAAVDNGAWIENRVSRFTFTGAALTEETPIVTFPTDPTQANGPNHNGGVIAFGPDGKLYGVTGDLNRNGIEQNNTAADAPVAGVGGIFRLNDDGTIPADNPFVAQSDARLQRLWSYGVRNSFGLTFDPFSRRLWMTENGPSSYDEINEVPRGWNGGWTVILGPDSRDPQNVSDLRMLPNAVYSDPEFAFLSPIAITSIVFLSSNRYNATLRDVAIVGDNNRGQLYLFNLNAARDGFVFGDPLLNDLVADSAAEELLVRWGSGWGVTTDLKIGPDGYLYVVSLTQNIIRRIVPDCSPCDASCDGSINEFDIEPFVDALTSGGGCSPCAGDVSADGSLNQFDIQAFVECLGG